MECSRQCKCTRQCPPFTVLCLTDSFFVSSRAELNELGLFDDIIAAGVPQAQGAKAAILFSVSRQELNRHHNLICRVVYDRLGTMSVQETADIYFDDYGKSKCQAIRHCL